MLLWHLNNIAHGHFDVTMITLHHVSTGYTWKHGQVIAVLIIHGFALWRVLHWAHFTGQKIGQNFFRIMLVISVLGTNPLSELVLAYSLLEPQGQISIRIEKKRIIHTLKWICNCHDFCQHIMKLLINITQGKGWAIIGSLVFWYMHHKLHILTSSYICILLAKLLFSIALVAFQFMASLCCESRSPCTWAGGLLSKIHIKCHVS